MPMPGTQEIRRPLLEAFKGEAPHNFVISEILELMAEYFSINLNDLSSGDKNIFKSRINEAKADLKKRGMLYNPSGNTYMITNAGREVLEDKPDVITDEYLKARRRKPLPVAEVFGIEPVVNETPRRIQEAEPETLPDDTDIQPDDEPQTPQPEAEPDTLQDDTDIQPEDEPQTQP